MKSIIPKLVLFYSKPLTRKQSHKPTLKQPIKTTKTFWTVFSICYLSTRSKNNSRTTFSQQHVLRGKMGFGVQVFLRNSAFVLSSRQECLLLEVDTVLVKSITWKKKKKQVHPLHVSVDSFRAPVLYFYLRGEEKPSYRCPFVLHLFSRKKFA